ncbi:MAG: tyrosine-type recombinase/integrase [Chitinophagaceae bacterium]|nr:tyrosine-type recombinase/integrase [Chitinophagaceae bacterium]
MEIPFNGDTRSFLDYLKFEKRYSANTIRAYQDDLSQFLGFLHFTYGQLPLSEITSGLIRSWLASLKEQKISSKTLNRKISALKSFFKYMVKTGVIEQSPMFTIVSPKLNKRLPVFVDERDIHVLLNKVEFPDSWNGRTDKLAIHIFYYTGIRLSELLNLKENQVNRSVIKVTGKGNKERIIPINEALFSLINAYVQEKNQTNVADRTYLLVNQKGRRLYPKYLYLVVRKYLSMVTTIIKKSPHILRHSFATHLTNRGADLHSVKELLGHSSLAATQVYTHNTIEKLKDAHKKAHPKA